MLAMRLRIDRLHLFESKFPSQQRVLKSGEEVNIIFYASGFVDEP